MRIAAINAAGYHSPIQNSIKHTRLRSLSFLRLIEQMLRSRHHILDMLIRKTLILLTRNEAGELETVFDLATVDFQLR